MTLRVSSTWVEEFRIVTEESYGTEESLMAKVMGQEFTPSWQMSVGWEWDRAIAGDPPDSTFATGGKGYAKYGASTFAAQAIIDARGRFAHGLPQVKATVEIDCYGTPVTLVGKADFLRGIVADEVKCKFGQVPEIDAYDSSLQWRAYVAVFGVSTVEYTIFHFKEPDGGRYCELKDIIAFRQFDYPELMNDLRYWLAGFVEWCHKRKLTKYLVERVRV